MDCPSCNSVLAQALFADPKRNVMRGQKHPWKSCVNPACRLNVNIETGETYARKSGIAGFHKGQAL